uniref:Vitamin K-dependent gamma-carboxylase n=1 Tax=Saccoglossus kowalevskii TaxID=10224 RepID=A0ABM0MHY6_SACKO|nr:PREDICTED: vitamin K-dependent gamma-carboxylase-like [Saccoglossus kowalevskii]
MRKRMKSTDDISQNKETKQSQKTVGDENSHNEKVCTQKRTMKKLFGFDFQDINEKGVVKLLNEPRDPSSLGVTRIAFGLLMIFDTLYERGFSAADYRWGDPYECRFPLFDFLKPLPVDWMYVAYLIMLLGGVGILLGLFYRLSTLVFVTIYWYIFFLDKTAWNNHSYLFGLIAFQMLLCDGNRYWSLDGLRNPQIRNAEVPLWNYALLRAQVFLVYFIAGLKKLDDDWVSGYSMESLALHWVFKPFRYFLTQDQVGLFIVHMGGLNYDLMAGYLLFFDKTRPIGIFLSLMFHGMNFFMFSIGMFPWTMLATMFIFCYADWPKKLLRRLPKILQRMYPSVEVAQPSIHCIYDNKDQVGLFIVHMGGLNYDLMAGYLLFFDKTRPIGIFLSLMFHGMNFFMFSIGMFPWTMLATMFIFCYADWPKKLLRRLPKILQRIYPSVEVAQPSIHCIYDNKESNGDSKCLKSSLKPTRLTRRHYSMSAIVLSYLAIQMFLPYSHFITKMYKLNELTTVKLLFCLDRVWDPRVDLVKADWSVLQPTSYLLPLLVELSPWRSKFAEIKETLDSDTDVVFVADFPDLYLENFVSEDLRNTSVQVLSGRIRIHIESNDTNVFVSEGEKVQLPAGEYHKIFTISETPSCYMYIYENTTEIEFNKKVKEYQKRNSSEQSTDDASIHNNTDLDTDPNLEEKIKLRLEYIKSIDVFENKTALESVQNLFSKRYQQLQRSVYKTGEALQNIIFGAEHSTQDTMSDSADAVQTHSDDL